MEGTKWNYNMLREHISEDMANHIMDNVKPITNVDKDKPWWMGNSEGAFTVKSAFQLIRKKKEQGD